MPHPITHGELLQLRDVVQGYCGIRLEEAKLAFLKDRLASLLDELGVTSLGALCQQLFREVAFNQPPNRPANWLKVLPLVTINETYFFRELGQLELFRDKLLPARLAAKADRTLRILSAPCSSGEEPYSIAMMLDEAPVNWLGWHVEIWGVDIDPLVVARAEAGRFPPAAFRATDRRYLEKYFEPAEGGHRVNARLKGRVKFRQGNLLELDKWPGFTQFDAIFCRNMLIYFDKPTQAKVVGLFHRTLAPGGHLLLGHSESLMCLDVPFKAHATRQAIYYEKEGAVPRVAHG